MTVSAVLLRILPRECISQNEASRDVIVPQEKGSYM